MPGRVSNQSVSVIFEFDVNMELNRVFPGPLTEQRSLVVRASC